MRNKFIYLLAVTALALTPVPNYNEARATLKSGDVISVSGSGRIEVDPDLANLDLAVVTRAKLVAEAQAANTKVSDQLTQTLMNRFQIDNKDLKTVSYTINPEYKNDPSHSLIGYIVRHQLLIVVRNLKKVGEVLDVSANSGANEINSISFGSSNQKEFQLQALKLAVEDATTKANVIALAAGRAVSRMTRVTQTSYHTNFRSIGANALEAGVDIFPGQLAITSSVEVEFEF